jgi:hypothetical protein
MLQSSLCEDFSPLLRCFAECNYSGGTIYFPNLIIEMFDHSFSAF